MKPARLLLALVLTLVSMAASAADFFSVPSPRFDELERRLQIRPEQKDQYDLAVGATKRALLAVGLSVMEMKQRLGEELLKPRPDFSNFFRGADKVFEQHRPLFKEAGREWDKLFKMLDRKQVDIVRDFLRENLGALLAPSGSDPEWI